MFDITEVSKSMSKPTIREPNKSVFVSVPVKLKDKINIPPFQEES